MNPLYRTSDRAGGLRVAVLLVLALLQLAQAFVPTHLVSGRSCALRPQQLIMSATAEHAPSATSVAAKRPRREIQVVSVLPTPGGYLARVEVNNFNLKSKHHVTASKEIVTRTLELAGAAPALLEEPPLVEYYQAVFRFMLQKGMPLANTEGMINAGVFPVNLFAVKQLSYFHPDAEEGVAALLKEVLAGGGAGAAAASADSA